MKKLSKQELAAKDKSGNPLTEDEKMQLKNDREARRAKNQSTEEDKWYYHDEREKDNNASYNKRSPKGYLPPASHEAKFRLEAKKKALQRLKK